MQGRSEHGASDGWWLAPWRTAHTEARAATTVSTHGTFEALEMESTHTSSEEGYLCVVVLESPWHP